MSQTINRDSKTEEESQLKPPVIELPKMRRLSDLSNNGIDHNVYKAIKEKILFSGNSLQMSKFTFEDNLGNERSAEVIKKRYNIGSNTSDDTVSVLSIAILKRHILCDCLILVRQYRPTVRSYVLEFPAKIIEHTVVKPESIEETGEVAIRDLENSTGYKSSDIHHISPETALDPELCDGKIRLVSIIIDGDDPIKNGFINGHHNEKHSDVEVHQVPINGLLDRLNEYSKKGIVIDSRVYAFAIGLKRGEKLAQIHAKPENIETPI